MNIISNIPLEVRSMSDAQREEFSNPLLDETSRNLVLQADINGHYHW